MAVGVIGPRRSKVEVAAHAVQRAPGAKGGPGNANAV